MEHEHQDHEPHGGSSVERALEEVRDAERELHKAHHAEEIAEDHLKEAIHDLEKAEHNQPQVFDLIINTRAKPWSEKTIAYSQVVTLAALPLPPGQDPDFTIIFEDGPGKNPSGTLVSGQSVIVKNEMVFHVTPTNRS